MARFRFPLEPVLEHRRMIEEERQRAVAVVERERLALEDSIRAYQGAITGEKDDLRQRLRTLAPGAGGAGLEGVRRQAAAAIGVLGHAQRAVLQLAGVHKRLEAARAELLEAAKRRKAVELLRERLHERWRLEQSRREAAEMDELAVMRGAARPEGDDSHGA